MKRLFFNRDYHQTHYVTLILKRLLLLKGSDSVETMENWEMQIFFLKRTAVILVPSIFDI